MNKTKIMPISENQHARRPLHAVILSITATGLGHIYCGHLLKGLVLFFASFAFAPIIVQATRHASSPLMLTLVITSFLLLVGISIYAVIDAGLLAQRLGHTYQRKEYNRWYVYLLFIVVSVSYPTNLASSIRHNVMQAFKIPSQSMAPAILPGDRVLLNKARYRLSPVRHGDVVVFIYPDDRRLFYLKRVIALPGESVEIRSNVVYLNDSPLALKKAMQEPVLNFSIPDQACIAMEQNGQQSYPVIIDPAKPANMPRVIVPHGQCFVLADNRQVTAGPRQSPGDSRELGPIPLADVMGRVACIYWPALNWRRLGPLN